METYPILFSFQISYCLPDSISKEQVLNGIDNQLVTSCSLKINLQFSSTLPSASRVKFIQRQHLLQVTFG